jgi:hypothetical protein
MFELSLSRPEFGDTLAAPGGLPVARNGDALDQLLAAERSDWVLLRLVLCSAAATLLLGLAGSLVV